MKTYRLPTSDKNTKIYGKDFLDAIKNNLERIATITRWDREQKKSIKITYPVEEVYCQWSGGIIGGTGGVVIIMRGGGETHEEWLSVPIEEWKEISDGQDTIEIPITKPIEGSSKSHDLSTGRVTSRNERLNEKAKSLGYESFSTILTMWDRDEIEIPRNPNPPKDVNDTSR